MIFIHVVSVRIRPTSTTHCWKFTMRHTRARAIMFMNEWLDDDDIVIVVNSRLFYALVEAHPFAPRRDKENQFEDAGML